MDQKLGYDVLKIVLASIVPVTLGAICYNPVKRKFAARRAAKEKRAELEEKRDAALERVERFLTQVQHDQEKTGKLLEQSIRNHISEMGTLEITLMAIQGYKLNGNVTDALKVVRAQKDEFMRQLASASCSDIGQGVE